jgi:hypothetical protein
MLHVATAQTRRIARGNCSPWPSSSEAGRPGAAAAPSQPIGGRTRDLEFSNWHFQTGASSRLDVLGRPNRRRDERLCARPCRGCAKASRADGEARPHGPGTLKGNYDTHIGAPPGLQGHHDNFGPQVVSACAMRRCFGAINSALHTSNRVDRILHLLGIGGPEACEFWLVHVSELLAELVERA